MQIYKDDRKIQSMQIQNQINKFLAFVNAIHENGSFHLEDLNRALDEKAKVELAEFQNKKNNDGVDKWFKFYYNFTSYVIVAIYITTIGLVMADFTDQKIDSRMKISSKKFLQFNGEIYLGQFTIASMITFIFILGSILLKGKYISEVNLQKYIINIVVFSFSILCLTFFINNLTKNKFIINGIGIVLSLGTSFLSGVMVPQQLLSDKVLKIAKFFPTYYFVKINDMRVNSFLDVKAEILMQLLFALAFLLLGLYFSRVSQKA